RLIAGDRLRERDMHVGKRRAGAWKRAIREIPDDAPGLRVTRVPGELPAPQKGSCVVQLSARRPAMHLGSERVSEELERCRRIPGLKMAERQMPTQMAV